jgi:hypothetical protein
MTDAALIPPDSGATVTQLRAVGDSPNPTPVARMRETLQRESVAMLHYALEEGKEIPPDVPQRLAQVLAMPAGPGPGEVAQFADLTYLHAQLSTVIAPARGRTLVLLDEERRQHPGLYVFGPVRLVRQMLGFAVFALVSTCLLSTLKTVDVAHVGSGWFPLSGWNAFSVLCFLLSVAGLGAAFSNLSAINHYIEQANYDPTFEGSYWVRVVLGLISGVVLGEILFDLISKGEAVGSLRPAGERIVLAFLGGFATAPVQRLLNNLSDAGATLLQGRNAPPALPRAPPPVVSAPSSDAAKPARPAPRTGASEPAPREP